MNISRRDFTKRLFAIGAGIAVSGSLIRQIELIAKPSPRMLKAVWSTEASQDLLYYHGLDAESELTAIMTREIQREIDSDIISSFYSPRRLLI